MSKSLTSTDVLRYGVTEDPGFSAARNEAVIAHTIKRTEELQKQKQARIEAGLEERSDLVYSYIRHMQKTGKDMKIEDYAGWHNLKSLWSESRLRDIQQRAIELGYNI